MSKSAKLIIAIVVIAAVFTGVYFVYNALKDDYSPEEITSQGDVDSSDIVQKAVDFTVEDKDGKPVQLSDYFGKPIVLNFWASWCYYCKVEMPDFNDAYLENPDVQFLMINVTDGNNETLESAKNFVSSEGFEFPVMFDTTLQAASSYGATGLPMTFFINKEGNLVNYAAGMLDRETLDKAIKSIR